MDPDTEACKLKCCEGPEQVFFVTCGNKLPQALTLSDLKKAVSIWFAPGTTFYVPTAIGTRWQGWPQTV